MKVYPQGVLQKLTRNILVKKVVYLIGFSLETVTWEYTYEMYRKKYHVDPSFRFEGSGILLEGSGEIILGENGYIGRYSIIESRPKSSVVKIGNRCKIAPFVSIRTVERDLAAHELRKYGNVTIGDDVWIGTNAYINPNIQIGDRTVIGANSVVTKDIPSDVLACGCPAIIKKKIPVPGQPLQS